VLTTHDMRSLLECISFVPRTAVHFITTGTLVALLASSAMKLGGSVQSLKLVSAHLPSIPAHSAGSLVSGEPHDRLRPLGRGAGGRLVLTELFADRDRLPRHWCPHLDTLR
jgi:hypothetical protein